MIHGHIGKLFLRIPQLPGFTIHVLVTKIKNICQDGFMIIQICIVIKGGDLLELLWQILFLSFVLTENLNKKNCFHQKIRQAYPNQTSNLICPVDFNPYQLDVSISKFRGFWCTFSFFIRYIKLYLVLAILFMNFIYKLLFCRKLNSHKA